MTTYRFGGVLVAIACAASLTLGDPVQAATKYQTSLVPAVASSIPGFSSTGSSISVDGQGALKGKIKNVVDSAGHRVTTDKAQPADNYSVEVDLLVPATAVSATVTVPFDLKNGNGQFTANLKSNAALAGAVAGDAVAVTAVRVKDGSGTVIGYGGVALQ